MRTALVKKSIANPYPHVYELVLATRRHASTAPGGEKGASREVVQNKCYLMGERRATIRGNAEVH